MLKKFKIFSKINELKFTDYWQSERAFGQNHYHGDEEMPTFSILRGNSAILICAPHTIKTQKLATQRDIRIDENRSALKQKKYALNEVINKHQEKATGFMVSFLHKNIGTHGLVRNNYNDVNYKTKYDNTYLKRYLTKHPEIKFVIDLHGYIKTDKFDITCGTNNGLYLKSEANYQKLQNIMKQSFGKYGIKKIDFDFDLQAKSKYCISKVVNEEFSVMSMQMEVNKKYRQAKKNITEMKNFLKGMSEFIIFLEKFLKGE